MNEYNRNQKKGSHHTKKIEAQTGEVPGIEFVEINLGDAVESERPAGGLALEGALDQLFVGGAEAEAGPQRRRSEFAGRHHHRKKKTSFFGINFLALGMAAAALLYWRTPALSPTTETPSIGTGNLVKINL